MRYNHLINERNWGKNSNDSGYTLIELLAIIVALSLIIGIVIVFANGIINNAKEKSYKVTASNIENVASSYAIENHMKYEWIDNETDNSKEYFCVSVGDLMEMGFLDNEALDSYIGKDEKVKKTDYIYLERDINSKSITKNLLVPYHKGKYGDYCGNYNTGVDIEFTLEPSGWAKEKTLTIKYKIFNLIDDMSKYEYRYDASKINKDTIDNKKFNNLIDTEVIENITSNGIVDAYVKSDNLDENNKIDRKESYEITGIDRDIPLIQLSIDGNGKEYSKSRDVTISLVDNQSGLKKGRYTINYDWSLEEKVCDELTKSIILDVNDDKTNIVGKKITISNETGNGKLYVCGEGVSDNVMNVATKIESSIDLYLDNVKPVISLGNYNGNSTVHKNVIIPLVVSDKDSGINKDSITVDDITVLIGGEEVVSGVTLSLVNADNYNLKINNSSSNGDVVLKIKNDKILDNAENGNELVEFDTGITFINTYLVKYDANGGSGAPANQLKVHDVDLTLSSTKPTRNGYSFDGWKDSDGITYSAGGIYKINSETTMVAQWKSSKKYIIKDGVVQDEAVGLKGYNHKLAGYFGEKPKISYKDGYIKLTNDNWMNVSGSVFTLNKIDFSGFNSLKFSGDIWSSDMVMGGGIKIHSALKSGEKKLELWFSSF